MVDQKCHELVNEHANVSWFNAGTENELGACLGLNQLLGNARGRRRSLPSGLDLEDSRCGLKVAVAKANVA